MIQNIGLYVSEILRRLKRTETAGRIFPVSEIRNRAGYRDLCGRTRILKERRRRRERASVFALTRRSSVFLGRFPLGFFLVIRGGKKISVFEAVPVGQDEGISFQSRCHRPRGERRFFLSDPTFRGDSVDFFPEYSDQAFQSLKGKHFK